VETTVAGLRVLEIAEPEQAELDGLLTIQREIDADVFPEDPPIPPQELAVDLFRPPARHRKWVWLATVAGEAAGSAVVDQELDGTNDASVMLAVQVGPAWRRQGVGRALARVALAAAADQGATSVLGWPLTSDGAAFCEWLGMTRRQDDRCSRLRLSEVDEDQQRRWRDEAPARTRGYRLVGWVGLCPDEWAARLAQALTAMVDAPIDDLDWDPQSLGPAEVQDRERHWDDMGYDLVTTLALAPDGAAAGASVLAVSRLRPMVAEQGDTGVVASHRGHALGRWLKSENLRRAREHQPAMEVVQTFNAASNPHMLGINVEMGFRPYHTFSTWQGPLADVRSALGSPDS
jgi:mycothiol synthase